MSIRLIRKSSLFSIICNLLLFALVFSPFSTWAETSGSNAETFLIEGSGAAAASPPLIENALSFLTQPLSGDAAKIAELQMKRDRAAGRDSAIARIDPHYMLGQIVELYNKQGNLINQWTLGEPNADYVNPPLNWSLKDDIKIEIVPEQNNQPSRLRIKLVSCQGRPLPRGVAYTQTFEIPGVQSVLHDDQHIHILLKNGDFLSVLMPREFLFQANSFGDGGPTAVGFVRTIVSSLISQAQTIDADVHLEFFDAVKKSELFHGNPETLAVLRQSLRYGDILVGRQIGDKFYVEDTILLAEIALSGRTHAEIMLARTNLAQRIDDISQLPPILSAPAGVVNGAQPEMVDHLLRGRAWPRFAAETAMTTAMAGSRTDEWKQHPLEDPNLISHRLLKMLGFYAYLYAYSLDTEKRPTVANRLQPPPDSLEARVSTQVGLLEAEITEERKLRKWSYVAASCISGARYVGEKIVWLGALPIASVAAVGTAMSGDLSFTSYGESLHFTVTTLINSVLHLVPADHFFRHLDHRVLAFDLSSVGGAQGPSVYYWQKFLFRMAAATGLIIGSLRYFFPGFAPRLLGHEVPKTIGGGLTVFYSMALRLFARVLQSYKSFWARDLDATVHHVKSLWARSHHQEEPPREHYFEELIETARRGISPQLYRDHRASVPDVISLQKKMEALSIVTNHTSLTLILSALVDQGLLKTAESLDFVKLQESLGPQKWKSFLERSALVSLEVWNTLESHHRGLAVVDEGSLLNVRTSLQNNQNLQEHLRSISSGLIEEERLKLQTLKRSNLIDRIIQRFAGQNRSYYEYYRAEVPKEVVDASLYNSYIDLLTTYPCSIFSPTFSSIDPARAEYLVATDKVFFGLGSIKFDVGEVGLNAGLWSSTAPTEVRVWAKEQSQKLNESYRPTEDFEDFAVARIQGLLVRTGAASIAESEKDYLQGYSGLRFWEGVARLGKKFAEAEIKYIKIFFVVTMGLAFLSYGWEALEANGPRSAISELPEITNRSFVRGTLSMAWAYVGYRIWWVWNGLGFRVADTDRSETRGKLADILFRMMVRRAQLEDSSSTETLKKEAAHASVDLSNRLASLYERHGKDFPKNLEITDSLDAQLTTKIEGLIGHAISQPPAVMAVNAIQKGAASWTIGILTTVIGLFGFGYVWEIADAVTSFQALQVWVGLYGFHKALQIIGRGAQVRLGYEKILNEIQQAIMQAEKESSENNAKTLFLVILKATALYHHHEASIPAAVVDQARLRRDLSVETLRSTAVSLRDYMLLHPPADPSLHGYAGMASVANGFRKRFLSSDDSGGSAGGSMRPAKEAFISSLSVGCSRFLALFR